MPSVNGENVMNSKKNLIFILSMIALPMVHAASKPVTPDQLAEIKALLGRTDFSQTGECQTVPQKLGLASAVLSASCEMVGANNVCNIDLRPNDDDVNSIYLMEGQIKMSGGHIVSLELFRCGLLND
jgi:hypothetical protein